jgi:Tol biopolymer transport system component
MTSAAAHEMSAAEQTPAVSTDGRYVAYAATQGEFTQVFVRDTCLGATGGCQPRAILVSAAADGAAGNADSAAPSMSADGRYVAFSSAATNLVSGAPEGRQVYLRDTCLGAAAPDCTATTMLISVDADGELAGTESILPSVSASGRFVAFVVVTPNATAASADPAGTKPDASATSTGSHQVFVRDTCFGAEKCTPKTTRISSQPSEGNGITEAKPALSGSANRVALAGAAALFTPAVAVDDRIFLAATANQK